MTSKTMTQIMEKVRDRIIEQAGDFLAYDRTFKQIVTSQLNQMAMDMRAVPARLVFGKKKKPVVEFYILETGTLFRADLDLTDYLREVEQNSVEHARIAVDEYRAFAGAAKAALGKAEALLKKKEDAEPARLAAVAEMWAKTKAEGEAIKAQETAMTERPTA